MIDICPPAVLLGSKHTAMPVARNLGRAGVAVIALGERDDPRAHVTASNSSKRRPRGLRASRLEWLLARA